MPTVRNNYVCRKSKRFGHRNWWLVKAHSNKMNLYGTLILGSICFPEQYIGKKIRLKVEFIEEGDDEE